MFYFRLKFHLLGADKFLVLHSKTANIYNNSQSRKVIIDNFKSVESWLTEYNLEVKLELCNSDHTKKKNLT